MEILHCFGLMHRGGAETMLMNLYRNIDKSNYNFNFLVHSDEKGDYDEEINELGGRVHCTKSLGDVGLVKYIILFRRVIAKMPKIDIIHIHMDWQCGYIALAAHLSGIKNIVVHSHTNGINKPSKIKKFAVMCSRKLISRYAQERFACSEEAAEYLYGKDKYHIINNAIDVASFEKLTEASRNHTRKQLGISKEEKLLCHVGRLSDNKNQLFLVRIIKELIKVDRNYRLILIGRGEEYNTKITEYIKKNNLSSFVQLLGVQEDIPKYLNASDFFLFPSKREGFGMVVVEAQAAALNCIVSSTVPKSVDLKLGLVSFSNINNIDQWIEKILGFKPKGDFDKHQIKQAIKEAHFDIEEQAEKLESIYFSLMN